MNSTYSFANVYAVISHPGYGSFTINGEGLGNITVSKETTLTKQAVAADGSVLSSKIAGNHGSASIKVQQTSAFNKYMQGLFNYLQAAPTDQWSGISFTVRVDVMGIQHLCQQGAFEKEPDRSYDAEAADCTWKILFNDVQTIDI